MSGNTPPFKQVCRQFLFLPQRCFAFVCSLSYYEMPLFSLIAFCDISPLSLITTDRTVTVLIVIATTLTFVIIIL